MKKEMMLNYPKDFDSQILNGTDCIIDSYYCDNIDESIINLINALITYAGEKNGEIEFSNLISSMHEWNEYEVLQNDLLELIKFSIRNGFLKGLNINQTTLSYL